MAVATALCLLAKVFGVAVKRLIDAASMPAPAMRVARLASA